CSGPKSQPIRRAGHAFASPIQPMRVDHGRAHIFIPQQLLDGLDVVAILQEVAHEPVDALQSTEQCLDLLPYQYHWEALWPFGTDDIVEPPHLLCKNVTVEKEQGIQGLILSRDADMSVNGQRR